MDFLANHWSEWPSFICVPSKSNGWLLIESFSRSRIDMVIFLFQSSKGSGYQYIRGFGTRQCRLSRGGHSELPWEAPSNAWVSTRAPQAPHHFPAPKVERTRLILRPARSPWPAMDPTPYCLPEWFPYNLISPQIWFYIRQADIWAELLREHIVFSVRNPKCCPGRFWTS